jgi:hypothetical protein
MRGVKSKAGANLLDPLVVDRFAPAFLRSGLDMACPMQQIFPWYYGHKGAGKRTTVNSKSTAEGAGHKTR